MKNSHELWIFDFTIVYIFMVAFNYLQQVKRLKLKEFVKNCKILKKCSKILDKV